MKARAKGDQFVARSLAGSVTLLLAIVFGNTAAAKPLDKQYDPQGDGEPIRQRDGGCTRPSGQPCWIGRYKQYDLTGPIAASGTVSFQALVRRATRRAEWVPKKVRRFEFDGLPVTCDDGAHTIDVSSHVRIRVKRNNNFSYQFSRFTGSIEGKLTKHGEKATGQFSYGPSDSSGLTNCASDRPLGWSAELHNTTPCNRLWRHCF